MVRAIFRLVLAAVCLLVRPANAQELIQVDPAIELADVSRTPLGMNVNYLLDNDRNRPEALRTLAQALRAAGVKYLRYPGGEKSDGYLWSIPPYTSSAPTLARWAHGDWPQNQEWPSYDRALVGSDGHTFTTAPLGFDEFMSVCEEIGCVPTIVVCYDSMYKPPQQNGVAPTREQLLETAREWVRYANITRGYGIRYWEIGNESWQTTYNGGATADAYASDLVEFSRVMKAVDPSIRIGASGASEEWWRTVLAGAGSSIDFLAVHNYPAYGWPSYSAYADDRRPLASAIDTASAAIQVYASPADRDRLTLAVTETAAATWSATWPDLNDLGHALLLFDILGEQLRRPEVGFSQLWNTRWSGNDTTQVPVVWDALDRRNNLQASASVLAVWSRFLKEKMVASSATGGLGTYASYAPTTDALTVFAINRSTQPRLAALSIANRADLRIHGWAFTGTGSADLYPSLVDLGEWDATSSGTAVTLPPVSVVVMEVTAPPTPNSAISAVIQAEDFEEDAYWDATPENSGGAYRSSAVDIEATSDTGGGYNVGWITPGEWLGYRFDLTTGGTYRPALRIASPYDGTKAMLIVDGALLADLGLPNTGDWQNWQTVPWPAVSIASGAHQLTLATATGGFNINWIALDADAPESPGKSIPGVVQAEDFDEEAYWDSTAGNAGGEYRSTAVDIQPTSDSDGGYNVGWITPGEWLEYTIVAPHAGTHDFSVRVASPYQGTLVTLAIDGVPVGTAMVPDTGGWQTWTTVEVGTRWLGAGSHHLDVSTETGGFNLNYVSIQ